MKKSILQIAVAALVVVGGAYAAIADPMGWFAKAQLKWSGTDFDKKFSFNVGVFKDGSAEALILALDQLPAEEMPAFGHLKIDNREYKFAKRELDDGNSGFYASIPVEGIPINESFVFEMYVENYLGEEILYNYLEYEAETPP